MAHQPVPDRRLAPIELQGDLRDRHAALDERRQLRLGEAAFRGVSPRVGSRQVELLQPIRHRRFVAIEPPADLGERKSLCQQLLQDGTLHAPYCLQPLGRNRRSSVAVPP